MMQLVQQRGIFTSGDHMIVNHGDSLFNIYFTTPLIASCIQEDDPAYCQSDFNNFGRLDTFDSDLWNNNEHFSQEEVVKALAVDMQKIEIKVVNEPLTDEAKQKLEEEHAQKLTAAPATAAAPTLPTSSHKVPETKEEKLAVWNTFLRAIARQQTADASNSLDAIFQSWTTPTAIVGDMAWFRIFEQLILTSNPELLKQKQKIVAFLEKHSYWNESVWKAILKHWGIGDRAANQAIVALDTSQLPTMRRTPLFYQKDVDIKDFWEYEWLTDIFPNGIDWRSYEYVEEVGKDVAVPLILYFNPAGKCMSKALYWQAMASRQFFSTLVMNLPRMMYRFMVIRL
jgi:hypothetical protein